MHPDYLHVLLNPIPVYGLAMGVIGLLLAFALPVLNAGAGPITERSMSVFT